MPVLAQFSHLLKRCEELVAGVALGAAALIVVGSVIMRYVFDNALSWAEEGPVTLLLFSSFVGASLVMREKEHVGIDILATFSGPRTRKILTIISLALTAFYCGAMGVLGWQMITDESTLNAVTPALGLPEWLVRLALPLGLTLMFLRALEILFHAITETPEPPPTPSADAEGGLP